MSKIILNHCWWASQIAPKWTRPFVLGVAVGIAPQHGWHWQHTFTVRWFHLLSPESVVESANSRLLSLSLFCSVLFFLPTLLPHLNTGKGSNWLVQSWRELMANRHWPATKCPLNDFTLSLDRQKCVVWGCLAIVNYRTASEALRGWIVGWLVWCYLPSLVLSEERSHFSLH